MKRLLIILLAFLLLTPIDANSQRKRNQKENNKTEKVYSNINTKQEKKTKNTII